MELGAKITTRNTSIVFREAAATSLVAARQAIEKLSREGRPTPEDAIAHADGPSRRRFSKFEPCVPDGLLSRLLAERTVDLDGARQAVAGFAGIPSHV